MIEGTVQQIGNEKDATSSNKEQKRRYRRHPKPDINAPEKPPSAYVLFSNTVRDEVKSQNLSFTEIARLVGDRWQKLDPEEKSVFENRASDSKDEYNRLLTEYKKTDDYKRYVSYLADFRAKHGGQDTAASSDSKRPKLTSDKQSSQDTDETQGDDYDGFQARSQHDRAGSIGSVSTVSRSGTRSTTSLQIVTPVSRMNTELGHRSPSNSKITHDFRNSRTPIQSYRRQENTDSMDTDGPNHVSALRYDSPSSETSHSTQSFSQERVVDSDSTSSIKGCRSRFHAPMYSSARPPPIGPELNLPPINSGSMPRPKPNAWDGYGLEGTRQPFSSTSPTLPPPAGSLQQSARPPSIGNYSPISQLVNSNQDFGERTLPPIHRLSTTGPGYGTSPPGVFVSTSPDQPQLRPPGSEKIAYRPGRE